MVELADTLASGASGRKVMQVQVLFRARGKVTNLPTFLHACTLAAIVSLSSRMFVWHAAI